jgi:hypothetical protein
LRGGFLVIDGVYNTELTAPTAAPWPLSRAGCFAASPATDVLVELDLAACFPGTQRDLGGQ